MNELIDMTGQKYGRLTVIRYAGKAKDRHAKWLCLCECGKEVVVLGRSLRRGSTQSCGCLQKELTSKRSKKENIWVLEEDGQVVTGVSKDGRTFQIDADDWGKVRQYYWFFDRYGYVATNSYKEHRRISLHRLIMDAEEGVYVDHINHCISDNRKSNLRICTPSQNLMNGRKRSNNTSGVKGVNYIRNKNLSRPWEVRIWINGNPIRKRFSTKEEAVAQRKAWEQEYYGEFAYNEDEDVLLSKAVN